MSDNKSKPNESKSSKRKRRKGTQRQNPNSTSTSSPTNSSTSNLTFTDDENQLWQRKISTTSIQPSTNQVTSTRTLNKLSKKKNVPNDIESNSSTIAKQHINVADSMPSNETKSSRKPKKTKKQEIDDFEKKIGADRWTDSKNYIVAKFYYVRKVGKSFS